MGVNKKKMSQVANQFASLFKDEWVVLWIQSNVSMDFHVSCLDLISWIHTPTHVTLLCPCLFYHITAPSQAPGSIEWNLTNSRIFLNWEHVKALENESEVTGYKVSVSLR